MALAKRLRQVEKCLEKAGLRKQTITLIVVCGDGVSEEQQRKAIADYEASNPPNNGNGINTVYVRNEHAKQCTEANNLGGD